MARKLSAIWILECSLTAHSPLAVGGVDPTIELPIARDGAGRPYVRGTSLAGCLRSLVARAMDKAGLRGQVRTDTDDPKGARTTTDQLFGFSKRSGDGGLASLLQVEDAPIEGATLGRRDGVAIDRWTGAAADNFLYSREVIEPGARLPLRLVVEVPDSKIAEDQAKDTGLPPVTDSIGDWMPTLARLLNDEGLTVGAAGGRGLGRLRAENLRLIHLNLSEREHVALWWRHRAGQRLTEPLPAGVVRAPAAEPPAQDDRWTFKIHWRPLGPILVKSGQEGPDIRQLPLTVRHVGGGYRAVLPGSSIRGALRSHAERIIRTIRPFDEPISNKLLEQLQVEVVQELFGRARAKSEGDPKARPVARGVLSVLDCLHTQALPQAPLGLASEAGTPLDAPAGWPVRSRIAVDRWTGGALDSALFRILEPAWEDAERTPRWEAITLELDLHRLSTGSDTTLAKLAMGLLWLVLRDLADGELPLGFGTRQGLGRVGVSQIIATHGGTSLGNILLENAEWQGHLTQWEKAWTTFAQR